MSLRRQAARTRADVRRVAEQARAAGATIVGCSLCARLVLKPGQAPAPCPLCGAIVTRRRGGAK